MISVKNCLLFISLFLLSSGKQGLFKMVLKSPDGHLVISTRIGGTNHVLSYFIQFNGQSIIAPSSLGLQLKDGTILGNDLRLLSCHKSKVEESWKPVYGERNQIPDRYQQATIDFQQKKAPFRKFDIIIRVYNEGIAFRYEIPKQHDFDKVTIEKELTAFNFKDEDEAWVTYSAQGEYQKVKLSQLKRGVELPLTIKFSDTLYAAIGEAAVVDFASMKLNLSGTDNIQLIVGLGSPVAVRLPLQTPWRYIMVGRTPGTLLEHNYLLLNLNKPNQLKNTSWIRPGKVIREVTLTTQGAFSCIDFAAKYGLQYIELDAGWYGAEDRDTSDATHVAVDPARSSGPLNMRQVIRYANAKHIGVILYVNNRALQKQLDTILPLYHAWGIKGIKFGFVNVGAQQANTWLMRAVRKAARYHLMVDIHDEYRPTGYSRTYPNLMTQEGIRGDEASPSSSQTITTVFTRMLAGAADNTVCYFDKRVGKMGSHASQLAKTICLYSPWQFVFWYDKPPASPGAVGNVIKYVPELSFFKRLPTVWDQTKVLEGKIGRFVTVARRSGNNWYVGTINGNKTHTVSISFDFLKPTVQYTATIYTDSAGVRGPTGICIRNKVITYASRFTALIEPDNGMVIVLNPIE